MASAVRGVASYIQVYGIEKCMMVDPAKWKSRICMSWFVLGSDEIVKR